MAKKKVMRPAGKANWFPILLTLVGLWFLAAELGWLTTYGLTLWPIVITVVGLKFWFGK